MAIDANGAVMHLEDHPVVTQLNSLKAAFDRVQVSRGLGIIFDLYDSLKVVFYLYDFIQNSTLSSVRMNEPFAEIQL